MNEDPNALHFQAAHNAQAIYRLPPGARQILLIRHGSSVGATSETIELGALVISDSPLSPAGEAQAQALGQYLSSEAIAAIFVTPLQRTRQTAAPLAARLGLEMKVIADLREVHLGDWEHTFYQHVANEHPLVARMFTEETFEVLPNAETMAAVGARVRRGIAEICDAVPPGSTVAAFSHAGIIAEICREATGSRNFAFTAPDNSSVTRLIVQANGGWKLRSFNELAHLRAGNGEKS